MRSAKDWVGGSGVETLGLGFWVEEGLEEEGLGLVVDGLGVEVECGSIPWSSAWRLDQNWRCEGADLGK